MMILPITTICVEVIIYGFYLCFFSPWNTTIWGIFLTCFPTTWSKSERIVGIISPNTGPATVSTLDDFCGPEMVPSSPYIIYIYNHLQYNHTMWLIFGMIHGFTVYKHSQCHELAKFGLFIWDFVFLGIGLRLSLPRIRHSDSCVLDIQSYLLMFSILRGFKWHFVFGGVLRWEGKSASNLSNIIKYICINFDLLPKMGSHFSWCLAAPLPPHILRP